MGDKLLPNFGTKFEGEIIPLFHSTTFDYTY